MAPGDADTGEGAPSAAPPHKGLSPEELREEMQAASRAARQLLLVLASWPRLAPACLLPLIEEKEGAPGAVAVVLRGPVKLMQTLALICHNAKAPTTVERFKPLLPRLAVIPKEDVLKEGWGGVDEMGEVFKEELGALDVHMVVAVELSDDSTVQSSATILRGAVSEEAERGPWMYILQSGESRALAMPNFDWTGPLRPGRVSPLRPVRAWGAGAGDG